VTPNAENSADLLAVMAARARLTDHLAALRKHLIEAGDETGMDLLWDAIGAWSDSGQP
jgi:hypothetical protein